MRAARRRRLRHGWTPRCAVQLRTAPHTWLSLLRARAHSTSVPIERVGGGICTCVAARAAAQGVDELGVVPRRYLLYYPPSLSRTRLSPQHTNYCQCLEYSQPAFSPQYHHFLPLPSHRRQFAAPVVSRTPLRYQYASHPSIHPTSLIEQPYTRQSQAAVDVGWSVLLWLASHSISQPQRGINRR